MKSFTWGSDEGMQALIEAATAKCEKFEAEWNAADFEAIIYALREFALEDSLNEFAPHRERAWSILSSIAETYDVEFI